MAGYLYVLAPRCIFEIWNQDGVGNVPNGTSDTIGTEDENVTKITSSKNVSWADRVKGNMPMTTPDLDPTNPTHQIAKERAPLILLK